MITQHQQQVISTIVDLVRKGRLNENFSVSNGILGGVVLSNSVHSLTSPIAQFKDARTQTFQALAHAGLLIVNVVDSMFGSLDCSLTGEAYRAVDNNFNAPDTSFTKHITPLADLSGFDEALKRRCLPILAGGGNNPVLWDSALRTAGVILEERIREIGKISDPNLVGRDLVNKVFGQTGTLASNFAVAGEREGYRDLFAGVVGVFRNPPAHRLIDPTPEEGGATLGFINLLLKKLESLR